MTYDEIRAMPTVVTEIPVGSNGVHESMTRGYQIVQKVKWLLDLGTPPEVLRELIKLMETSPKVNSVP